MVPFFAGLGSMATVCKEGINLMPLPQAWRRFPMAEKRYKVCLTSEEREQLLQLVSRGKAAARKLTHAHILLKADESPQVT